ncbi:MAG: hypothetical protein AB7G08_31395 [Hyphomicrobiaceae bacterium]
MTDGRTDDRDGRRSSRSSHNFQIKLELQKHSTRSDDAIFALVEGRDAVAQHGLIKHLPAEQELVFFSGSWHNGAGVARVMGSCRDKGYEVGADGPANRTFARQVRDLVVQMPAQCQPERREAPIEDRREGSLRKWKIVSIDAKAIEE